MDSVFFSFLPFRLFVAIIFRVKLLPLIVFDGNNLASRSAPFCLSHLCASCLRVPLLQFSRYFKLYHYNYAGTEYIKNNIMASKCVSERRGFPSLTLNQKLEILVRTSFLTSRFSNWYSYWRLGLMLQTDSQVMKSYKTFFEGIQQCYFGEHNNSDWRKKSDDSILLLIWRKL